MNERYLGYYSSNLFSSMQKLNLPLTALFLSSVSSGRLVRRSLKSVDGGSQSEEGSSQSEDGKSKIGV